jgi:hypothetical protein
MALGLSGPTLPQQTVNGCLDQLKARVAAVPGLSIVYGYRTMRTELPTQAVVTSIASLIGDTPLGQQMAYDYIIDIQVRIDDDYEAAERALNALHDGIWRAIWGPNSPYWSNCYPYAPDAKPTAAQEAVNWRRGLLYVRVIPY